MTLEFAVERFSAHAEEIVHLAVDNWAETGVMPEQNPLNIDWDSYFAMERCGELFCVTARCAGDLVGYCYFRATRSIHNTAAGVANCTALYLTPEMRNGLAGFRMLKFAVNELAQRCAKGTQLQVASSSRRDISKLLVRLGFGPVETIYRKVL